MVNTRRLLRLFLSVFVVIHLFAVAVAPCQRSHYLCHRAGAWVNRYTEALGIASFWGFFAIIVPGTLRLDYTLVTAGADGVQSLETGTLPTQEQHAPFGLSTWHSNFATLRNAPANRFPSVANYLCHRHPGTSSVDLRAHYDRTRSLTDDGENYPADQRNTYVLSRTYDGHFPCRN